MILQYKTLELFAIQRSTLLFTRLRASFSESAKKNLFQNLKIQPRIQGKLRISINYLDTIPFLP